MSTRIEDCVLGIELGSTRIKATLIDASHKPVANGSYAWENRLEDGVWTYHLEDAVAGVQACFAELKKDAKERLGETITTLAGIGISGMMHGYLALDADGAQIAPFRTWRNTITAEASAELTERFRFNIPQRWSIAHLYQAIRNKEESPEKIAHLLTLSVYIHHLLTDEYVIGVGEASGMFPYDEVAKDFDAERLAAFDELIADRGFKWKLKEILPKVLSAGEIAGKLTAEGAALLDPEGELQPGIPFCPPEGDAGTGMVATGAVQPRTGSVSAGTSAFSLQVLEKPLEGYYTEIDVVATPSGRPVAMAHTNNCTGEIDAWVRLFAEVSKTFGGTGDLGEIFPALYKKAMEGVPDAGGMVSFNYAAGEVLTDTEHGRPLFVRLPDADFSLANFMRAQLYGALATWKLGIDFLQEKENVESDRLLGHGGFFKTPGVGAQILADAMNLPIHTMETAGEGGPWGMALLAAYMCRGEEGESLEDYLEKRVFSEAASETILPDPAGVAGFGTYMERYRASLAAEKAAEKMK